MIYKMSKQMYWRFINGTQTTGPMSHVELLIYVNQTFGLRGFVSKIQITN